ncbi:LysR family transcriptional regulator [Paracoccus nototheniae]|uniref:LysR family transcriptional regulator n=1 Tax=Paracoccus nototheniae TaxID=2489002 RepID=UPI00103CFBF0|nr:LysR family transcriptional regulator [Paracoccus nototheniae]
MLSSEDFRFFCAVASSRSLADAARQLNVTAPAVTQRLKALEDRTGVQLVERSTTGIRLTHEGELMLHEGRAIVASVDRVADLLSARSHEVRGHLRIAAPHGFGRGHVAPVVQEFARLHGAATVTLHLSDRPARLMDDSWDIVIHIGDLAAPGRLASVLAPNRRLLCAAPGYLKNHPAPASPGDLAAHRGLALRENDEDVTLWRFTRGTQVQTLRIDPAMTTNDGEVMRDWILSGAGIGIRSEWDVAEALAQGRLLRVLPEWSLPDADVTALLHPRRTRSKRAEAMLTLLRQRLKPAPWRQDWGVSPSPERP